MKNSDPDDYATPKGYATSVTPGWSMLHAARDGTAVLPSMLRVGSIDLPQLFETYVSAGEGHDAWSINLMYLVPDETKEITLWGANSYGVELDEALDRLRSARPFSWWKRKSLMLLTYESAVRDLSAQRGTDWAELPEDERRADTPALRFIMGYLDAAESVPVTRRRDRITGDVLRETAEVYRNAWRAGENPTMAVSAHFHKAHSTAARYVGLARKAGHLGPSDSSKGGEQDPKLPKTSARPARATKEGNKK